MQLLNAEKNIHLKVLEFEGGEKLQKKLTQYGLYPGDIARILRIAPFNGPVLIEVGGREIALGRGVAAKIIVEAL